MAASSQKLCDICFEANPTDRVYNTCGAHSMCDLCLFEFFNLARESELNYPPRCCHNSPMSNRYLGLFTERFVASYQAKENEYLTPPKLRIYCSNGGCERFLPSQLSDGSVATCSSCQVSTCTECRLTINTDIRHRCPMLQEDRSFEKLALEQGMKHCPRCHILIQLADACNHITCSYCGHSFCFVCLLPNVAYSKTHDCPKYNQPKYDGDGYDSRGLHKSTGLDREGYNRLGYNDSGVDRKGKSQPEMKRTEVVNPIVRNSNINGHNGRPANGGDDLDGFFRTEVEMVSAYQAQMVHDFENSRIPAGNPDSR